MTSIRTWKQHGGRTRKNTKNKNTKCKKPPKKKWTWDDEKIFALLEAVSDYKRSCEFNNIDFTSDLVKFYASVRITLANEFPDHFGIEIETNPAEPLKDMSKQEYDDYKDNLSKERDMIRKGKERVREKIKCIRQDCSEGISVWKWQNSLRTLRYTYKHMGWFSFNTVSSVWS